MMEKNNKVRGWPRVLCLELNGGVVVDRKDYQFDNDIELQYVDDRVAGYMKKGHVPDNDLFVLYYGPSFDAPSVADKDLPQYVRQYATLLKDLYGWETLVDGPLRLAAFCRSEGFDPTQANMTALAESPRYADFCRKYPPEPKVSQGNICFPEPEKKRIDDPSAKERMQEGEARQRVGERDTTEEKKVNRMKQRR